MKTGHVDVLIVGAGISGIGAAYHLGQQCPGRSFAILDALDNFGGTWRTHTYPGVRSDSDLHTFGYRFKPWRGKPIATAEQILTYLGEVIEENDLARHIHYRHKILTASWSSEAKQWTVEAEQLDTGEHFLMTANFLWMCQGYYNHSDPYTPEWPGMDQFQGRIVHPQTWPDDLDYTDKRIVVIGSGATAATLLPAMAERAAHITMLQRSPTYFVARPNVNETAEMLRSLDIPEEWTHEIVRRKQLADQGAVVQLSIEYPDLVRDELLKATRAEIGEHVDIDKHFSPTYRPWQQRLALLPDGDMFQAIRSGKVSVVTDHIDTFTETGIRVQSGEELEADIIVTATGFTLSVLGDIAFTVDEQPVSWPETVTYRGMMFTGVPNLAWVFGYFRASWTLRADLIGDFVCRMLQHMDAKGARRVTPVLRPEDATMTVGSWVDPANFNPGYLMRSQHLMPKSGDRPEWRHSQDYWVEKDELPAVDLDDGCLQYD